MLSDKYLRVDNWDVLIAALDGLKEAGVHADIDKCQLSERRMVVDVICPEISQIASDLLRDYRNPFDEGGNDTYTRAGGWTLERARAAAAREGGSYEPGSEPVIWAGFQISNSETGNGAFGLAPRIVFSPCRNGLKLTRDIVKRMHLGSKMDVGSVAFSNETLEANTQLVRLMTRDAIVSWTTPGFLADTIDSLTAMDAPVQDAVKSVRLLAQTQKYSEQVEAGILAHFIRGAQLTKLGLMNAVTSYAQVVESPDLSYTLENSAFAVLEGSYV